MSVNATLTTAMLVQTVPTLPGLSSALVTLGTLEMVLFAVMVRYVCMLTLKLIVLLFDFFKHVILQMQS